MNISMKLQDNRSNKKFDISDLAADISYETVISDQPGKLTFKCVDDDSVIFNKGSVISLQVEDKGLFYGYVFASKCDDSNMIEVTAYDQLRYLQNKDIYIISGKSASQVFEMVCKDKQLRNYKVVSPTKSIIPSRIHDNVSLFDVINFGIGHELRFNRKWYLLRDNFGILEFIDIAKLAIPANKLTLSDNDLITKFSYESTIDSDTYNQVKIMQESRESKKGKPVKSGGKVVSRDYAVVKDSVTINQWGLLQYFEKSDKHLNPAQLMEYARSILSQKNRETTSFNVSSIGDLQVTAGSQLYIYVDKVKKQMSNYTYFLVTSCTHQFKNNEHTMDLQLFMPQFGMEYV